MTVVLARSFVEASVPGAQLLHGRRIPRAASQGLGDAVLSLMRGAPALDPSAMAGSAGMVTGHLARIAGRADRQEDAGENASNRLRAVLFIEAHIVRPGLDVGAIVAGVGMSRSALYRAFEAVGGVEREIGRRRVARFRSALMRPGELPLDRAARLGARVRFAQPLFPAVQGHLRLFARRLPGRAS